VDLGRYHLALERSADRRPTSSRARPRILAMLAAVALVVVGSALPAVADGGATGYVAMPEGGLRSIMANQPAFDYDSCYGIDGGPVQTTVEIPNGICQGPNSDNSANPIGIENGAAAADILIEGTEFDPSDGATPWTLCVPNVTGMPPGPLCGAPGPGGGFPGPDQAELQTTNAPSGVFDIGDVTTVSTAPSCDLAFDGYVRGQTGSCSAVPYQGQYETPFFRAPQSSTDQSPVFSNTITWIAAPPSS
jgi:hypothetical protein